MTPLSKNAFAVLGMCSRVNQPFGMTVDPISRSQMKIVWAFKISADKARREGYDKTSMRGSVVFDDEFPGCPYCESHDFYVCGNCGTVVCFNNEEHVKCPKCGNESDVVVSDEINLSGGGM